MRLALAKKIGFVRSIFETAPDGIMIVDHEGKIALVNDRTVEIFGYSRKELAGRLVEVLLPDRFREGHVRHRQAFSAGPRRRPMGECSNIAGRRKDGTEFPADVALSPFRIGPDFFVTVIIRDIAERKRMERELAKSQEMLRQTQKMEAIGRLAGGIAHDFNNLLGIINGYCELSLPGLKDNDPLRDNLKEIQEAGERATALTRQLLAFSRRQVLEPRVLNLNDVLDRMDRMLRRLIGEDISLATVLDPGLGQVKADPGQMEQVIMNLALNARDAMTQGSGGEPPKLTLETRNVALDREYAKHHSEVQPGPYVMMAVSDTGTGIDAGTMAHVFEPFFTTKEKGKGTGLGLSTVHGIVKQSGGHVSVYSEPGHGTSFKVYLPRVEEKAEPLASREIPAASPNGSETVLVLEDDERLRKLICRILGERGYTVLEASSGEEALRVSGTHEGPIALLTTDVVMPGLSGRETAEKLSSRRPEIKVLYMSGYTDNAIVHHGVLEKGTHFLQKPFTPEALARKVREVLQGSPK